MNRAEFWIKHAECKTEAELEALHHEYYEQWVCPWLTSIVQSAIGMKAIKASTDPWLNDIPLAQWDRLDGIVRDYGARKNKELGNGSVWSLSDTVCITKAAARLLKEL
jgi:hypothetical protein